MVSNSTKHSVQPDGPPYLPKIPFWNPITELLCMRHILIICTVCSVLCPFQTLLSLGALLLIMFVLVTMFIFACFRVMNRGRFIHINEEVALLAANICLLFQFHDPGNLFILFSGVAEFNFTAVTWAFTAYFDIESRPSVSRFPPEIMDEPIHGLGFARFHYFASFAVVWLEYTRSML